MSPGKDPVPILVVEDNDRYAELIEHMLGGDFAPERAATLGDAVAALQHGGPYSCILLDLLLPGTDRLEAVEAIRLAAPESPIVVLTGMENGGLALDAMKAGVQDYLHKGDMAPETLRRAVIYAMERKRAQLAHEALHDPLTGLPNRTLFRDRCLQALPGIGRDDGRRRGAVRRPRQLQAGERQPRTRRRRPAARRGGRPHPSRAARQATPCLVSAATSSPCSARRSTAARTRRSSRSAWPGARERSRQDRGPRGRVHVQHRDRVHLRAVAWTLMR